MNPTLPDTPQPTPPALAGRGRRLAATLIDMLLVPLLTIVLIMITDVLEDAEDYQDAMWALWVLLLAIASYLLLNGYTLWRRGQTLGKYALGIAMHQASGDTDNQNVAPLWKLICIRALFFPLLFLMPLAAVLSPIALIPVFDQLGILSKHRRCLHDYASGTVVVRLPRNKNNADRDR